MSEQIISHRPKAPETEIQDIFSSNLRFLRKASAPGLSQNALARILQVPRGSYLNYESGKSLPPVYVVYCMAAYFGYTMEELLTTNLKKERTDDD